MEQALKNIFHMKNKRIILILLIMSLTTLSFAYRAEEKKINEEPIFESAQSYNFDRSDNVLYAIGYLAELERKYIKSIEFYKASLKKKPSARTLTRMAGVYYKLRDYKRSEIYANKSLKLDAKFILAYFVLARVNFAYRNFTGAINILKKIIKIDPENTKAHYQIAHIYFIIKNKSAAKKHYQAIINYSYKKKKITKETEMAAQALGNLHLISKNFNMAVRYFRKAYNINPGNLAIMERLGKVNFILGNFNESMEYYALLFSYFPGNVHFAAMLAQIHFINGRYQQMKKYLAYGKTPLRKNGSLRGRVPDEIRGLYLLDKGKYKGAEKIFRGLLDRNRNNITALLALVRIYKKQGGHKNDGEILFKTALVLSKSDLPWKAERILKRLKKREPKNQSYGFYLGRLYERQKKYYLAIVTFQDLLGNDSQNITLMAHLTLLYSMTGQYANAHNVLDKAIRLEPEKAHLYYLRGNLFYRENKFKDAEEGFKKAIKFNNKKADYYYFLAATYERMGRLNYTIRSLKKSIDLDPSNDKAYNFLGYLYADHKINLDESIQLILRALEFNPENAAYQDSLGWAYYQKGRMEDAYHHVRLAIKYFQEIRSEDPVVYDHLGDIEIKRGRPENAIKAWGKGIVIYKKEGTRENNLKVLGLREKIVSVQKLLEKKKKK